MLHGHSLQLLQQVIDSNLSEALQAFILFSDDKMAVPITASDTCSQFGTGETHI